MSQPRYRPYPEYKDSGVAWLGEVPAHWETKRLKWIFRVVNGSTPRSNEPEFWDGDISWVTPSDLGKLKEDTITTTERSITKKGYESCGTTLVPSGSLVLSTRAPIGHIAIAGMELCTNQGCRALAFRSDEDNHYFYYQLLTARPELQSLGCGSTFQELGRDQLKSLLLLSPPIPEQRAVARFLDHYDRLIRRYIRAQRRLIELLEEQKQALIQQAVTRGLDPDVPLKDSGIEWLGEIPAHWETSMVKRHFKVELGKMLNSRVKKDETVIRPYLNAANIHWDGIHLDTVNEMAFTPSQLERYRLKAGDLLVTEGGVTVGRSAIWKNELPECYYQNSLNRARSISSLSAKFLFYWMYFVTECGLIDVIADKATFGHLTNEKLNRLPLLVPPPAEANSIVHYLDERLPEFSGMAQRVEEQINLIREYRTRLIADVVTGKLDVCGVSLPDLDADDEPAAEEANV